MKFSYTALTKNNKKVTGVLDVESIDLAQKELHKMGVAIVSIDVVSDEQYEALKKQEAVKKVETGIKTFGFLAMDPNHQEIEGTIDTQDDYTAYKRLVTEYQFIVKQLYPADASDQEKELSAGKLEGFEARYEMEKKESGIETKKGSDDEDSGEKISEELIKEIDEVIISTKKVLENHRAIFSNDIIKEMESKLSELERVRSSNNIKHITEVSNILYDLVSHPDKAESATDLKEYKTIIGNIENSALVKKEFDLYKKAVEATGAKKLFSNLSEIIRNLTSEKENEEKKPGLIRKIKHFINLRLAASAAKKSKDKKEKKEQSRIFKLINALQSFLSAESPVLRKAHRKELINSIKNLFWKKKVEESGIGPDGNIITSENTGLKKPTLSPTSIWSEFDSFLGWLLCFYILYFFLVDFSLEKNIGLKQEFVLQTINSPLIINITLFLLLMHGALKIRNSYFSKNIAASIFTILFTLGGFVLIIVNF